MAAISTQCLATSTSACGSAYSAGCAIRAISVPMSRDTTHQATPPMSVDLASALSSSASDCEENMRPMPASGLSLPKFGATDLVEKSQPPSIIGATTAATIIIANIGPMAPSACMDISPVRASM